MDSPACPPPTMTVSTNSVISILRGSRFNDGSLFSLSKIASYFLGEGRLVTNAFRNSKSSTFDSASTTKGCQSVASSNSVLKYHLKILWPSRLLLPDCHFRLLE